MGKSKYKNKNRELTSPNNSLNSLNKNTSDIVNKLINSQDSKELEDLTNLFNLNMKKKNIVRLLSLNDMLDEASNQVYKRLREHPDEVTNKELLDFINTFQNSIEKTNKYISGMNEDVIQLRNQTNNLTVNVNQNSLSDESRTKIIDFFNNLFTSIDKEDVIEGEIVEEKEGIVNGNN